MVLEQRINITSLRITVLDLRIREEHSRQALGRLLQRNKQPPEQSDRGAKYNQSRPNLCHCAYR